jgi:CHAD domain-containing protein
MQLVGNAALVVEGEEGCAVHPGAIHQARVAIRRPRAAMALFARPLLRGDAEAKTLREALREAGQALGPRAICMCCARIWRQ